MVLYDDTEQSLIKEVFIHTEVPLIVCRAAPLRILYINSALEKEWGFYTDIIIEDPERLTEIIYTEDRATFIEKVIDNPLGYYKELVEFRMVMPDAGQKWYGLKLYPLRIYNWVVGILEDITERKCREIALQAAYDKWKDCALMLQQDLKRVVGSIEVATNQIKGKMMAKEQEELDACFELLSKIRREAVCHTGELPDRFFMVSENLEKEEVNLTEEIFQAIDLYRPLLEYKKLTLKVLLSESKMTVQVDKMKFWQIIQHLISNAIKFSHEEGKITIALKELRDVVVLEVSDMGIGIPSSFWPFIFQEHSPAMRNGTKGEKPTGMGTYIVKQMVEAHDGEVWFESEEGVGTTFFVKLPK